MFDIKYITISLWIIFISIIILIIISIKSLELSNIVTLVIEIAVGLILTVIVYAISRKSGNEIENKVTSISNIIKKQDNFRKEQERYASKTLLNIFNNMQIYASQILSNAKEFQILNNDFTKKICKNEIILDCEHIKTLAEQDLDSSFTYLSQFLDPYTIKTLKTISNRCQDGPIFTEDGTKVNVLFCNNLIKILEPCINEFKKKLIDLGEEISENTSTMQITVSLDRIVYPINSTVHLHANIPNPIPDESIIFEVFNEKKKLLIKKEISPKEFESTQIAPDAGIYQTSFKMDDRWKVGEKFLLKGIHGSSVAYDDALVDKRNPIVQSDKSIYQWNENMILTVIDPDADKDNAIPELVGNRDDSKLTISSSKSELVNCQLKETGDSVGIFEGFLRFKGIEDDGSTEDCIVQDKTITKIQEGEITDGVIEVSKCEKVKITYSNLSGNAILIVLVVKNSDHLPK